VGTTFYEAATAALREEANAFGVKLDALPYMLGGTS
jgi:hypothetical protein